MKVREYKPEEYETVTGWWNAHNWHAVPEVGLSPTGLMAEDDDGNPLAALWLYRTDSPVMMAEWLVTNPDNSDRQSYTAVKLLLESCKLIADATDGYLMTFLQDSSLVKIFEKQGFNVEEKPYTIAHYGG